jgi:hypothetical protein
MSSDILRKWEMHVDEQGRSNLSRYYGAIAPELLGWKTEAVSELTELAEGPEHGRRGGHNYYAAGLAESHPGNGLQADDYLRKALKSVLFCGRLKAMSISE